MAFPLDIRTELNLGGAWTDVSPDVYVRDAMRITRGVPDQGSTADPSSLSLTLDNRAGKYSQRNAMSPLFGMLGRNTPIRVSLPSDGDHYLQLDGRSENFVSTPDTAALHIAGDIDIRAEIAPDWYGSARQLVIGRWDRPTNQASWVVVVSNGRMEFRYASADAPSVLHFVRLNLPQLPERAAIRVAMVKGDGTTANVFTFYWAESLDAPDGWTVIATPVASPVGTFDLYTGTAPLSIGTTDTHQGLDPTDYPMNGRGYRFEVRNGIGGTVVASPDFRSLAAGTTSFTDSAGRTWTLAGNAEVRDREDRFVGEVASWPLKWSTDDVDRYAPITASGILRRLGQGVKALDSALRRRIPSGNPVAYWPMEEQQDAVQAYSPIPGVFPASVSSVEWASWDTLPSSAPLPRLTGASSLSAPVPAFTPGQWQVECVYNADDKAPTEDAQVLSFSSSDSVIKRWVVEMRQGGGSIRGYTTASAIPSSQVISHTIAVGADVFHGWTRLRVYAIDDADGAGFTFRLSWQDVGGDSGGHTYTYPTGSCGSLSLISADWPASTEGWGFGHLAVLPVAGSTLYDGSDNAYSGETAPVRMRRLAQEEGLSFTRAPGRLEPAKVGYQRLDSLVTLLEAAADAGGGLLTEDMRRIGLHYRDRSSLYTQAPALTLSYTEPGLGPDIEPVDDDTAVVNDVTVTRDGGSSARAVLDSGPLSVQPAPDGIGKYDASFTLSLAGDDQSDPVAHWRLHLGTFDGARYPTITLLLHKPGAASLIPAFINLREGDKIRLTNLPEWVSHDDVDLIVMGWSETPTLYSWEVTLNCVPAGPWNTAITDHDTFGKADADGSELAAAASATDTKLTVRTTAGPTWTEDPAFMPIPIRVSGEVMSATAIGPAVADSFGRTVASGWGSADSGQAWATENGSASDYSVGSGFGKQTHTTKNLRRICKVAAPTADLDVYADVGTSVTPAGGSLYAMVATRYASVNSQYFARVEFTTGNAAVLTLRERVSGTETQLASFTLPGSYTAGTFLRLRFQCVGSLLQVKVWRATDAEPDSWSVSLSDTSLSDVGSVALWSIAAAGNTNTNPEVRFDNLRLAGLQTFTVSRSVNGVVKQHSAGEAVNVANPPITSL